MRRRQFIAGAAALVVVLLCMAGAMAMPRVLWMSGGKPTQVDACNAIATLPNIVGFWRADKGVTQSGGNITAWADQSANGYNLSVRTGTTPYGATSFNGGPSLNFAGTSTLSSAASITWAGKSFSVVAFFQDPATQNTGFGRIMATIASGQVNDNVGASTNMLTNNNPLAFQHGYESQNANAGQQMGNGASYYSVVSNTPVIMGWQGDGTNANLYVNGGVTGAATTLNGPIGNSPNTLIVGGGHVTTDFDWTGNLGFLLITASPLTSGQRTQVNACADAHWGTHLAGNNVFNNLVFADNFASSSTVDLSNTKTAGFNWYLNNSFPVPAGNILSFINGLAATPSANVVVSSNTLTLSNQAGAPSYGVALETCAWNGSAVVGNTFGNGFYVDVAISFDPSLTPAPGQIIFWPAIWFVPLTLLNNTIGSSHWTEPDLFEAFPATSTDAICGPNKCQPIMTIHDEAGSSLNNQNIFDIGNQFGTGFTFTAQHHFQILWLPPAKNKGTGLWVWYVDGVQVRQETYSASGTPYPALAATNAVGALSASDNDKFCLFIDPGTYGPPNQPVTIYSAKVYQ